MTKHLDRNRIYSLLQKLDFVSYAAMQFTYDMRAHLQIFMVYTTESEKTLCILSLTEEEGLDAHKKFSPSQSGKTAFL